MLPVLVYKIAVVGTIAVLQGCYNQDAADAFTPEEKSYLNEAFMFTGGNLVLIAFMSRMLFHNGFARRILSRNKACA